MNRKRQISESFRLSALLSFSGGLQDAYTYNIRGHVFANAQTGNLVLMSQHFMQREWMIGFRYLIPLFSFALGILISEQVGHKFKHAKKIHWRQIILILEIILLGIVGILPQEYNMLANILVSLSCAMQVQSFRKVHGYGYASTMIIGIHIQGLWMSRSTTTAIAAVKAHIFAMVPCESLSILIRFIFRKIL